MTAKSRPASGVWFQGRGDIPLAYPWPEPNLFYNETGAQLFAVHRLVGMSEVLNWQLSDQIAELPYSLGSAQILTSYLLDKVGAYLPPQLAALSQARNQPADSVGLGKPTLLKIDDELRYASSWIYDTHEVLVTVHANNYICVVHPETSDPVVLVTAVRYRIRRYAEDDEVIVPGTFSKPTSGQDPDPA